MKSQTNTMKTYTQRIEELREAIRGSTSRDDRTVWYLVEVIATVLEGGVAEAAERGHAEWLLRRLHASLTGRAMNW